MLFACFGFLEVIPVDFSREALGCVREEFGLFDFSGILNGRI